MKMFKKKKCKHMGCGMLSILSLGIGIGILLTYPLVGQHPVRWAAVFAGFFLVGHFFMAKCKHKK